MEEDLRALDLEVVEQEKGLVVSLIYAGVSAVIYAQKVHLGVPPKKQQLVPKVLKREKLEVLSGHSDTITDLKFVPGSPEFCVSVSLDFSARLWKCFGKGCQLYLFQSIEEPNYKLLGFVIRLNFRTTLGNNLSTSSLSTCAPASEFGTLN